MDERIYFIGQDGNVHNISDFEYQKQTSKSVYIGRQCLEGFRVDDEVNLLTLKEACEFYK